MLQLVSNLRLQMHVIKLIAHGVLLRNSDHHMTFVLLLRSLLMLLYSPNVVVLRMRLLVLLHASGT